TLWRSPRRSECHPGTGGGARRDVEPSTGRAEFDVELRQASQQERGLVAVLTVFGGAVLRLADCDVPHAVEHPVDGDHTFDAGEGCARAGVNAAAERDVFA